MKRSCCFLLLLLNLLFAQLAAAGQIKVYVASFNVVGAANKEEMQETLQELLASRLSGEKITVVDSAAEADVVLTSRYSAAGGLFSIDSVARNRSGKVVARAFEEGENQSLLIPAVGKLAPKLQGLISAAFSPAVAEKQQAAALPGKALKNVPQAADVIKVPQTEKSDGAGWLSQRLTGMYSGIASGRILENGEREIFVVSGHTLQLYRQGGDLKLLAETSFKAEEQILGIDSADLDGDGIPEAYLTLFNGDALISQIWTSSDSSLKRVAEKLPYYFRGIALNGQEQKIYAQQLSLRADFFGDVYEVHRVGKGVELKNPLKLPRTATIYNFSQFTGSQGEQYSVVINADDHVIVYDQKGEELWRSKEKFGGSELFFKRKDLTDVRYSSEPFRRIFLPQRLLVTREGEIIVSQNSGGWSIGDSRSYSSSVVLALAWNGSSLDKRWHTKESENYVADYFFEPQRQELVTLEVVKREGMIDKGASIVAIRKVRVQGE